MYINVLANPSGYEHEIVFRHFQKLGWDGPFHLGEPRATMRIELNDDQLKIIQRALSDSIEKYVGVSQSQEVFINNIENGMDKRQAEKQLVIDNKKVGILHL